MFCIYLRTHSDLCHLQHKLIGFYNPDEKCLQHGTDWVFIYRQFWSLLVTWCTTSLTFNNCTPCPHPLAQHVSDTIMPIFRSAKNTTPNTPYNVSNTGYLPSLYTTNDRSQCKHLILNNKLTSTRQHNKYLLQYVGYIFCPVNRSLSGLHRNKSHVLLRYWDPNISTIVNVHKTDIGWNVKHIMSILDIGIPIFLQLWIYIKLILDRMWSVYCLVKTYWNKSWYLTLCTGFITLRLGLLLYFHLIVTYPLQCWTPYAVIYGLALLKMGIMLPETCRTNGLSINHNCCIKLVSQIISY